MIRINFSVLLLVATSSITFPGFGQNNENHLIWGKPLTLHDFLATPVEEDTMAANVSVSIGLHRWSTDKYLSFKTEAFVDRSESWMKSEFRNEKTLAHEQGHFDIAEVFARKMLIEFGKRKYLVSQLDKTDSIFSAIMIEMNARQLQYDRETKGGLNESQQSMWGKLISAELRATGN